MQPLNIFVVHPSDTLTDHLPNGAGWIDYNYLRGLAERGHTLHVATPRIELRDPVPRNLNLHLIEGTGSKRPGFRERLAYLGGVRRLLRKLERETRFDIAQQFTPVETGLSLAIAGSGIPLVLGPYSGHWASEAFGPVKPRSVATRLKHAVRDALAWLQQQQADALVITCPAAMERVRSRGLQKRVHVIPHGIHARDYPAREFVPGRSSILFLAVLEYWKGIFTLLEAFDRVAAELPHAELELWGDGKERQAVEEWVARSPHRDRIHLRGRAPRERVSEIMRSHSLYCMPSYGEPFGMTLLEAMASGVPVVTTDAGGPPSIVQSAGGRVVPMRDVPKLAEALVEILSKPELQVSMGEYNRRRIEQEYDWSRQLDRMEAVYEAVLGEVPHSPENRQVPASAASPFARK